MTAVTPLRVVRVAANLRPLLVLPLVAAAFALVQLLDAGPGDDTDVDGDEFISTRGGAS